MFVFLFPLQSILLDFYLLSENQRDEEPPYHIGFSYILPSAIKHSEGQVVVPITSVRHRPIGEITRMYIFDNDDQLDSFVQGFFQPLRVE